ncbi:MAG: hypothetical protein STSR0003_03830 [Smithella sp.]
MTPVWLAFWVGAFIGATVGILVIACCFIARREDDATKMEMEEKRCGKNKTIPTAASR